MFWGKCGQQKFVEIAYYLFGWVHGTPPWYLRVSWHPKVGTTPTRSWETVLMSNPELWAEKKFIATVTHHAVLVLCILPRHTSVACKCSSFAVVFGTEVGQSGVRHHVTCVTMNECLAAGCAIMSGGHDERMPCSWSLRCGINADVEWQASVERIPLRGVLWPIGGWGDWFDWDWPNSNGPLKLNEQLNVVQLLGLSRKKSENTLTCKRSLWGKLFWHVTRGKTLATGNS